jgi:hypothetical protein
VTFEQRRTALAREAGLTLVPAPLRGTCLTVAFEPLVWQRGQQWQLGRTDERRIAVLGDPIVIRADELPATGRGDEDATEPAMSRGCLHRPGIVFETCVLGTNILSAMRFDPTIVSASDVATTPFNRGRSAKARADLQSFARSGSVAYGYRSQTSPGYGIAQTSSQIRNPLGFWAPMRHVSRSTRLCAAA